MLCKQFYLESLGHALYFIGSEQTGEALVFDVRRDVDIYFAEARRQGMCLRYAADSHQHNDYLTGICELPARADVQLLAGARTALGYTVRPMQDGERLEMGEIVCEVLHTPGHTPEHISLLVTDRSRGDAPTLLLSGGALLVGAVHITGAALPERASEVPKERRVAVMCGSGYRPSAAASLLKHRGYSNVVNVLGGMSAWQRAGRETVQDR